MAHSSAPWYVKITDQVIRFKTVADMCFFDQTQYVCGCAKWNNFRQHCTKEYRTGETCGMKLVFASYPSEESCSICKKMATKQRRIEKEESNIRRWRKEKNRNASIGKAQEAIEDLEREMYQLEVERSNKRRTLR